MDPDGQKDPVADATLAAPERTLAAGPTRSKPDPSPREITIGDRLGAYRIERRLGAGGMGEVYEATRIATHERVALKVLAKASATHLYRFKREFRALADVSHPNLISLDELVVPVDGPAFFTMELIEGQTFCDYVRGGTPVKSPPNIPRLERALRQLIVGVHHLHKAQCLHRDLKPSNVLVTREGRVVVLDFGLVSELGQSDVGAGVTHDGQLLGTPLYMAPEQVSQLSATGTAADYYALGVMLYECLTGRPPFTGSALQVLMHKQDGQVPDPRELAPGIPDGLRELCMRMLSLEPERRPTGRDLLEHFGDLPLEPNASRTASSTASGVKRRSGLGVSDTRLIPELPFVGRAAELTALSAALRDVVETSAALTVNIHGTSGLGKTALVDRFVSRARRKDQALILRGRCLERESVPYKGVDTIIDALSLHLRRLTEIETLALRPRHLGPLTRIFPILGDVWGNTSDDHHEPGTEEAAALGPTELRRRGLAALRDVIVRLSVTQPLIISIDDFHWADVDSVRLLSTLMRPPQAPRVLLLLAYRDELADTEALRALADAAGEGRGALWDARELALGPLSEPEARELARALLPEELVAEAEQHARRARGNPFYLGQLALNAVDETNSDASLDRLVVRRILELDHLVRRALSLVALAGGPLPSNAALDAFARSSPADAATGEAAFSRLCELGLLSRRRDDRARLNEPQSGTPSHKAHDERPLLEVAHARIREVAIEQLGADEFAPMHLALAEALELIGAEPDALAVHFEHAGQPLRAADYTERAAKSASAALAFARAVKLYQRTIDLLPDTAQERRTLARAALADQLVNLGHGSAAADLLLELADKTEAAPSTIYRRRAAEQLLRSGRIDEAFTVIAGLVEDSGEPLPRGRWSELTRLVFERLRLRLRGSKFNLRDPSEIPAEQLARLDTLQTITGGLAHHEVMLAQALQGRVMRLAYDAGDPRHIVKALVYEAVTQVGFGQLDRARHHIATAREVLAGVDDLELEHSLEFANALLYWFSHRTRGAKQHFGALLEALEERCSADWIRAATVTRYADASQLLGDLDEIRRRLPAWLATARDHGNLLELVELEQIAAVNSLYFDDLDGARRHLALARELWKQPRYTFQATGQDTAEGLILLYAGEPEAAIAHIDRFAAELHRSGLGRFKLVADVVEQLRARACVRAAMRAPANPQLLNNARAAILRLRKIKNPHLASETILNEAALHSLAGDLPAARRSWRLAVEHLDEQGMQAHLAAARHRLAQTGTGRDSRDLAAKAKAYFDEQALPNPERFVDMMAPMHKS